MQYEDISSVLGRLRNIELTSDLVVRSQRFISEPPALRRVVMKKQPEIFFPPFVDKLYWCFFIIKEGMASFEGLGKGVGHPVRSLQLQRQHGLSAAGQVLQGSCFQWIMVLL